MFDWLTDLWTRSGFRAIAIVLGSIVVAFIAEFVLTRIFGRLVGKTKTKLDDEIIEDIRRPIFMTVILIGLWWTVLELPLSARVEYLSRALLLSIAIVFWLFTLLTVTTKLLGVLAAQAHAHGRKSVIHPRTIPVFDILLKIALVVAAAYFTFLAWNIDPTAWIASAGILGIAVGFAAKDSLANLFAGIFIIADAPYKLGDYIVLEGGTRGRVTAIGIRSTRILTLDDTEITIPNSTMGNSMIVNEVGGPSPRQRVTIDVSAAYGADVDMIHKVLCECAANVEHVCEFPKPVTRFVSFGDSGLNFKLHVWLSRPEIREKLVSELNENVYKAFAAANIEIPYPKRDIYVRQLPKNGPHV